MRVKNIGSNKTEVETDKFRILVSYETPVAFEDKNTGDVFRTAKKWSVTTSKQINQWLDGRKALEVPQSTLDSLL